VLDHQRNNCRLEIRELIEKGRVRTGCGILRERRYEGGRNNQGGGCAKSGGAWTKGTAGGAARLLACGVTDAGLAAATAWATSAGSAAISSLRMSSAVLGGGVFNSSSDISENGNGRMGLIC
jgi:hypothetical protein